MRSLVAPTRRGQRATVVLAVFAVLLGLLVIPVREDSGASALTQSHQCGPNDANRAQLTTYQGGLAMRPCLTPGSNLNLNIPRKCSIWPVPCDRRFTVDEIRRVGKETVKMADGSTQQLWHFSFAKFTVGSSMTLKTTNGTGHTLTIAPDSVAQLGGTNDAGTTMYTDLWISDGEFAVAGFCYTPVGADSSLVALVNGANLNGCGLNLNIKYLVTYNKTPGSTGQYPLRLPATTVTVR